MISEYLKQITIPQIMGILNLTEDSFSDGGYYLSQSAAIAQAEKLIAQGADIIDIGAESTRPGAHEISADLEWRRIHPVLKYLKSSYPQVPISIDTQKATVAAKAIEYGADIINDVSALRFDPEIGHTLAGANHVKLVLMHMQGRPQTMQQNPQYNDILSEVIHFLNERIEYATNCGITKDRLIVDPGIGFGKKLEHNLKLLANLDELKVFAIPILLGASRKQFINNIHEAAVQNRLGGTLAATAIACLSSVQIIRVHDVFEHAQFLKVLYAIAQTGVS